MRPVWQRWPTVLAVALVFLNVDYVLMPALTEVGITGWRLFWIAVCCATAEPVYWNWYAKWLVRNVGRSERVRRVAGELRELGLTARLKEFGRDGWNWFVDHAVNHGGVDDPTKQRMLSSAVSLVRGTHILMTYPLMLGLGMMPSGWPFAIIVQRTLPVPGAFIVFLVANAMKTYVLGLAYLWLPWWAKVLVLVCAVTLATLGTGGIVRRVRAVLPR